MIGGRTLLLGALLALLPAGDLAAQEASETELPGTPPAVRAALLLRGLDGAKRVLVVGAHPDDEDTALLTVLSRVAGARTAYLSLTRGEGGQNLIGPELGEGLGLVRTGELLAARALDGAEQYFTRAFDFGYSKTAEETFRQWPRDSLLADVVRVVRTVRPHVLVSVFDGDPSDGHGQHQVAGMLTRDAFHAAGDPDRFPEQLREGLEPWAPDKLYVSTRFSPDDATLVLPTGELDPLLGASAHQVAMGGRSRHRSQDMGRPRDPGPRSTSVRLVESRVEAAPGDGLFAGVDTALSALVGEEARSPRERRVLRDVERYRAALDRAAAALRPDAPAAALPPLTEALERLRAIRSALEGRADPALDAVLRRREAGLVEAALAVAGIRTEARVDPGLLVPGGEAEVRLSLWNGGGRVVSGPEPALRLPRGWEAAPLGVRVVRAGSPPEPPPPWEEEREPAWDEPVPDTLHPGDLAEWRYRIRIAPDADLSLPYYLEAPRQGALHRWPEASPALGLPRDRPPVEAGFRIGITPDDEGGGPVRLRTLATGVHVDVDKASGEYRERVLVVPRASVEVDPATLAWPLARREARSVEVRVRAPGEAPVAGTLALEAPGPGWEVEPASVAVRIEEGGEGSVAATFTVRANGPLAPGLHRFRAVLRSGEGSWDRTARIVDHPHVERALLLEPAVLRVSAFDVDVDSGTAVGYVMGSGDEGPEALRQLGVEVRMLGPEALSASAFEGLDAIVLGVRAYETRPHLRAANQALLDWARDGGTLVVQYNKWEYPEGGFAPWPVDIARPHGRVTDETAPVTLLDPRSPVFTTPNEIGPADFEGWVQERGLYFLSEWDERYTPLLEMADPGEAPERGALVVAPLGEGLYVYTGLALFRQLPAGVPGAYRLLANLVSLDWEEWRAHHAASGEAGPPPLR